MYLAIQFLASDVFQVWWKFVWLLTTSVDLIVGESYQDRVAILVSREAYAG
jgi:hypothetical protein